MMKNDTNPAVLFLSYGTAKGQREFLKECKKRKLGVRELKFYDVEVPIEKYNETVNWFKSIVHPISQRLIDAVTENIFVKPFIKKIQEKTGYKLMKIDYSKFKHDYKCKGKLALLTPVACEYREGYKKNCSTKEEKDNYDKLYKFESKGYKNKTLKKQGIFNDENMDMSACELAKYYNPSEVV